MEFIMEEFSTLVRLTTQEVESLFQTMRAGRLYFQEHPEKKQENRDWNRFHGDLAQKTLQRVLRRMCDALERDGFEKWESTVDLAFFCDAYLYFEGEDKFID